MENETFELLEKIYIEIKGHTKRLDSLESEMNGLKSNVNGLKSDVKKIGATINGEIIENIKILFDEQSIIRKELLSIKELQDIHNEKIDDLKLAVDYLVHKQNKQKKELWDMRKVK